MEKKFVLADVLAPPSKRQLTINWELCILCQQSTNEVLTCPAKKTRAGEGYKTLAVDLESFSDAGLLPEDIDLETLRNGTVLCENFQKYSAKFHKTCRVKFDKYKLNRLLERQNRCVKSGESSSNHFTRSKEQTKNWNKNCFFCEGNEGTLHSVATQNVSDKISSFASTLQDQKILAKLSEGDLIAIEARYHRECYVKFCNRKRSSDRQANQCEIDDSSFSVALAELKAYVQVSIIGSVTTPVFKLSKLVELFRRRLEQISGSKVEAHSTRIKDLLLDSIPELIAFPKGRDVVLTLDSQIGDAIHKACEFDCDLNNDTSKVQKLIGKIRSQVFEYDSVKVCALDKVSQENSVSPLLLSLVNMLLYGSETYQQLDRNSRQEALTIAQLVTFNMKKDVPLGRNPHHSHQRETPFPVYLSMMIHAKTRKRELVDKLHKFGIGISYDRVMNISSALCETACEFFENCGVVCSPYMHKGEFVTGAVDNIDLNPSSTTAVSAFHGTAISLQQHISNSSSRKFEGPKIKIKSDTNSKKVPNLPEKYTHVTPIFQSNKEVKLEPANSDSLPKYIQYNFSPHNLNWLQNMDKVKQKESDCQKYNSLSSFNSNFFSNTDSVKHKTQCELLPMFAEVAHSPSMIAHAMKVVADATNYLNEGQTPVITCDAPLFAIVKYLQWALDQFAEKKYVAMLGGLHIEKAMLSVLGDLLDGSGWVEALIEAKITSSGRAESFIHVHHITRTRYAHQVTFLTLYLLQKEAYQNYVLELNRTEESQNSNPPLKFEEWCEKMRSSTPQFAYWSMVMELEDSLFEFLTSVRSSNFELYIKSLTRFVPWFFSFNHFNYARWLSVHLRDMMRLKNLNPDVYKQFSEGKFTANISNTFYSAMSLDQAHELRNALVKGDGGAVGLTENPQALRRWMIAGPEVAKLLEEFEEGFVKHPSASKHHHDVSVSAQSAFSTHVKALYDTIQLLGNPFEDSNQGLVNLHNKVMIPETGVKELEALRNNGKKQFENFVRERFEDPSVSVTSPLKRNQVKLFNVKHSAKKNGQLALKSAKSDAILFSRLFIAFQQRGFDALEFFSHENQLYPPALSIYGNFRKTKKSDLLQCFRKLCEYPTIKPLSPVIILDGPAVVHLLPPKASKTFGDYAEEFCNAVLKEWASVARLEIVWDDYRADSLKNETRMLRGSGTRRKVYSTTPIPRNWNDFLRNSENKLELFDLLSEKFASRSICDKKIVATKRTGILFNAFHNSFESLHPCTQEEADTRIFLHAKSASQAGFKSISIRTVDTDVVVLALANFPKLDVDSLWIIFGTGKHLEFIPIHLLFAKLGVEKASSLPFFHTLTGCDNTSSFAGYGKKTAWETFNNNPDLIDVFRTLSETPKDLDDTMIEKVEKFVVMMYDKSATSYSINECRKELFTKKNRLFDRLPPTRAALVQHILRSAYQAGHCWSQCLVREPILPDPKSWGWTIINGILEPIWTTLPEASIACRELISCGCKSCSTNRCTCKKSLLKCTMLCKCQDCENKTEEDSQLQGTFTDEEDFFDEPAASKNLDESY